MALPFINLTPAVVATGEGSLLQAALDGDLRRLKGIIKNLGMGPAAVLSVIIDGFGVLHCAACHGHLEVCKYLVEELGGDPNMTAGVGASEGVTPLMLSVHTDDVCIVKYFLDHGGDPMKANARGSSVLHYAVCRGSCKVTEFLLSEGIPVDIDCGHGPPLDYAAADDQDMTLKILLDHNANPNTIVRNVGSPILSAFVKRSLKCMKLLIKAGADVNCKGSLLSPLLLATSQGGYADLIPFLLKAGADPNVPDDLGWLPIERAALLGFREEVKVLLSSTLPIPDVPNWSIDGIISYAKFKSTMPLDKEVVEKREDIFKSLADNSYNQKKCAQASESYSSDEETVEKRLAIFKSQADDAFRQKKYALALESYSLLLQEKPDGTLYSNRSLCKLKMGDGKGALLDANQCRMMRPDWSKACYRQAAAHMLLKEYKQAYDTFLDAEKLDPGNDEIKRELRKAMELMKLSPGQ